MTEPLYHVRLFCLLAACVWLVAKAVERRRHPVVRLAAAVGAGTLGAIVWVKAT